MNFPKLSCIPILFPLKRSLFKCISYPVLSNSASPYFRYSINFKKLSKLFKKYKHTLHKQANPWWCPMKGTKALGTILRNSSTNSNLKLRHLSEKRILNKSYRQNLSLLFNETCLNKRQLPNNTYMIWFG